MSKRCPKCSWPSKVTHTRAPDYEGDVRRNRRCLNTKCAYSWSTLGRDIDAEADRIVGIESKRKALNLPTVEELINEIHIGIDAQ